jgi:endonuclease/exonuclease/phosphatase family metal-dependent hydrolase
MASRDHLLPIDQQSHDATGSEVSSSLATSSRSAWRRRLPWIGLVLFALASLLLVLFAVNGLSDDWRTPTVIEITPSEKPLATPILRVLALNAAKCWFHEGGLTFASTDTVRANLDAIADAIDREKPDIVCLSEVVTECGPAPLDQVEYLARRCGFAHAASGDNYSFGLPFFRIRSGNALLTSLPMRALSTMQLTGGRPFWSPTNNRRALWCEVNVAGQWVLLASIRNDSFDIDNNLAQTQQILEHTLGRPALLAGDFNAEPDTNPMRLILSTGRFAAGSDLMPTFPARSPTRRIDRIFGPAQWKVVGQSVVDTHVSDHLGVVTNFELH